MQMVQSAPRLYTVYSCGKNLLRCNQKQTMGKTRAALMEKVRIAAKRKATPSYAIIDSQSVKTISTAEECS